LFFFICFPLNTQNHSSIGFILAFASSIHNKQQPFWKSSGVLSAQSDCGFYHLRRAAVSAQLKRKVGLSLSKAAALRITLNLDGAPIISRTHTHPSHS
jgi:hypothetical protein